jgi:16S rRNA (uracil1498-N3)-methyltransferase
VGGSRGKRPNAGDLPASCGVDGGLSYLPRFFVESADWFERRSQAAGPAPATPKTDLCGQELPLDPEDSHHAVRVLRLGVGDPCEVVLLPAGPGSTGVVYQAVATATAGQVRVRLVAPLEGRPAGAAYTIPVGLVQATTRPAVTDYLLEKGTEVGASFFLLVPAAGSAGASRGARLARWRRIVREAAKQSKQLAVPSVEVLDSIDETWDRLGVETISLVLEPGALNGLHEAVAAALKRGDLSGGAREAERLARLALWVGPESGWTGEELEHLDAAGAKRVRLGQSVLRAETAGPVAVAVARLALGDW